MKSIQHGLFGLVLLAASGAAAQTPPAKGQAATDLGSSQDRPWARAVTVEEQKIATDLFREGNGLLKESLFVGAAEKYREALRHWDHPGIHYNLALALLNLDQPVEVYNQLEVAMKYGHAPLDADKFEHAGRYKSLIEKQLARVEINCGQPGAQVSMDGRPLYTAPGHYEGLVRVGQHTVVATKTGFVTTQKEPMLPPGQKTVIDLKMYTAEDLTTYKRHWHNAFPWTVFAAGIAVAGVGGIMHWQASEKFKSFDSGIASCSSISPTGGCVPDEGLAADKSAGEGLQSGAIAMYAIGGAALVTGAVLVYLNRAKPYHINPDGADKVAVTPLLGPNGGGAVATFHF